MTHDPLCRVGVRPWEDNYCCQRCNPGEIPPWERACQCDLIAEVRADERKRHMVRVPEYGSGSWSSGSMTSGTQVTWQ